MSWALHGKPEGSGISSEGSGGEGRHREVSPLFSLAILQPHSMAVGSRAAGQERELSAKQGLSLP